MLWVWKEDWLLENKKFWVLIVVEIMNHMENNDWIHNIWKKMLEILDLMQVIKTWMEPWIMGKLSTLKIKALGFEMIFDNLHALNSFMQNVFLEVRLLLKYLLSWLQ